MKNLLLILVLSLFSIQSLAAGCPDGSEPVKSISDDGTYFVFNCDGGSEQASSSTANSPTKKSSNANSNSAQAKLKYKEAHVDEVNVTGTGYYGRLLLVGDFNSDGKNELLYMRMSSKYMDYLWKYIATRKDDLEYQKAGIKLARKNPQDWHAGFVPSRLTDSNKRGAYWNAKFNGSDGCIQPAQIVPANLNGDPYTDFLIVCHGWDAKPFPGEHSLVALSDGADTYNVKKFTDNVGFYHDGDIADFNDDGFNDILVVDQGKSKKAYVYLNDGLGNFTKSNKFFPQSSKWPGAYGTEIIDVNDDGQFDVGMFGHEESGWKPHKTMILLNDGSNKFSSKKSLVVPAIKGWGTVLDMIVEGDNLFVLRSSYKPRYQGVMIQQVDVKTMKTIATLKNKDAQWYSRIFRKRSAEGIKFGGLTNETNVVDFELIDGLIELVD